VKRLRELAWVDGRNLAIEYRWAEGRPERASEIAAEFVRIRAGEPWRCQRPGEVTEPVDRRQTVLRCLFENGGGDAEHESGTPTPQMPIFRAHVRCALRPGRMCDALARSACELVHTAGGGISAIGGDMREHVLLFCLLGLVLTATIILVTAPEAVTWALSLVE